MLINWINVAINALNNVAFHDNCCFNSFFLTIYNKDCLNSFHFLRIQMLRQKLYIILDDDRLIGKQCENFITNI